MFAIALIAYLVNVSVGVMARLRWLRLGKLHHVLFALVFASAVLALWVERHPGLWLTVGCLAAMPKARPNTRWHPLLAALGLLGYILVFLFP